jgi:peptidoglycan hydrolase-like amidase
VNFKPLFLLGFALLSPSICAAQTVKIGVLGRFHASELFISAGDSQPLLVAAAEQHFILEPGRFRDSARLRALAGDELLLEVKDHILRVKELHIAARSGESTAIVLSIPGMATRRYRGTLTITSEGGALIPVVDMDLETAVASAVLAESAPGTAVEALKAQAVVARSYYIAGTGRHQDFDFCDLTHCQSLREPPAPGSPAASAASETRGLVLSYEEKPIATMFTRSCGGRTRTPAEVGLPSGSYPYFAVVCDICHRDPVHWSHIVSLEDAALLAKGEAGRLVVARRLGWSNVPSNNFTARTEGGQVVLNGTGQGHGIGLCQRGAMDMARQGSTFADILAHYFPNTKLISLPHRDE